MCASQTMNICGISYSSICWRISAPDIAYNEIRKSLRPSAVKNKENKWNRRGWAYRQQPISLSTDQDYRSAKTEYICNDQEIRWTTNSLLGMSHAALDRTPQLAHGNSKPSSNASKWNNTGRHQSSGRNGGHQGSGSPKNGRSCWTRLPVFVSVESTKTETSLGKRIKNLGDGVSWWLRRFAGEAEDPLM